jgi:uncharacterized protein YjiS (DUF1127 family)
MDIGRPTPVEPEVRNFGLLAGILRPFRWLARRRAERATLISLAEMDAYMLRDIGIEPHDVYDALEGRNRSLLFHPRS